VLGRIIDSICILIKKEFRIIPLYQIYKKNLRLDKVVFTVFLRCFQLWRREETKATKTKEKEEKEGRNTKHTKVHEDNEGSF